MTLETCPECKGVLVKSQYTDEIVKYTCKCGYTNKKLFRVKRDGLTQKNNKQPYKR